MSARLAEQLHLSPSPWPEAQIDPSDLNKFIPNGLGLGAPMVMRPWDSLADLMRQGDYYGYDRPSGHPLHDAPSNVAEGGVIYFDDGVTKEDFAALVRLFGIQDLTKEYAAIWSESQNPQQDRYLDQLRIVTSWALQGVFEAPVPAGQETLVNQPLTIGEALWAFIEDQEARWGRGMSRELDGTFGGDGDWAKESLCFGLLVENSYRGIYRIWSRAWLVTK